MEGKVLDLTHRLKLKAQQQCKHESCEVSLEEQVLTCSECGVELDPWWYLRRMATEEHDARDRHEEWMKAAHAEQVRFSMMLKHQQDEVNALIETKNRLWNESVGGKPLGTLVDRRRTRRKRDPG